MNPHRCPTGITQRFFRHHTGVTQGSHRVYTRVQSPQDDANGWRGTGAAAAAEVVATATGTAAAASSPPGSNARTSPPSPGIRTSRTPPLRPGAAYTFAPPLPLLRCRPLSPKLAALPCPPQAPPDCGNTRRRSCRRHYPPPPRSLEDPERLPKRRRQDTPTLGSGNKMPRMAWIRSSPRRPHERGEGRRSAPGCQA